MTYRSTGGYTRHTPPTKTGIHHRTARKLGVAVEVVLIVGFVLAIIVGLAAWFVQYQYGSEHSLTFKIDTTTSVASGSTGTGHLYQVYTGKGNVLANSDALFHLKFDSANVQAWLFNHQGDVVTCPTFGYRVPVFSSFRDILDGCKVAPAGTAVNY